MIIFNTICHFDKVPRCVYICHVMSQWTWGSNFNQMVKRKKKWRKNKFSINCTIWEEIIGDKLETTMPFSKWTKFSYTCISFLRLNTLQFLIHYSCVLIMSDVWVYSKSSWEIQNANSVAVFTLRAAWTIDSQFISF